MQVLQDKQGPELRLGLQTRPLRVVPGMNLTSGSALRPVDDQWGPRKKSPVKLLAHFLWVSTGHTRLMYLYNI